MSGGQGGGSSTTVTGPPAWEAPFITNYLSLFENLIAPGGKLGKSPLPNQQVAGFNPQQQEAFRDFSLLFPGAQGAVGEGLNQQAATAGGAYLDPNNPFLNKYLKSQTSPIIQQYQTAIAPSIAAEAAATGTLGGSNQAQNMQLANYDLATALGNVGASTYEAERGLQQQAAQGLPGQAAGLFLPAQELLASGGQQQAQQQSILDTLYRNLYQKAIWPYQEIGMLGQGIGQITGLGNVSSTTQSQGGGK